MKRRRGKPTETFVAKARARAALKETDALKLAVAEVRAIKAKLERLPRADLDVPPAEVIRAERDGR
jgi:hypothetical protein